MPGAPRRSRREGLRCAPMAVLDQHRLRESLRRLSIHFLLADGALVVVPGVLRSRGRLLRRLLDRWGGFQGDFAPIDKVAVHLHVEMRAARVEFNPVKPKTPYRLHVTHIVLGIVAVRLSAEAVVAVPSSCEVQLMCVPHHPFHGREEGLVDKRVAGRVVVVAKGLSPLIR